MQIRLLRATILLLTALVTLTGIEVVVAWRREYLPTDPALEIAGEFGGSDGEHLTFVVLGDSTAAGIGAGTAEHAYPTLLAERLAEDGYAVELLSAAVSGARAEDVAESQVDRAIAANPDLVFIGIGGNDVTHLTRLGEIDRHIRVAVRKLRAEGAVVVVAGAPDMRAPAFLEPLRSIAGWRGRLVADRIEVAAAEEGAGVVKLAEVTGPLFASDPDRFHSSDRFHPTAAGYRLWAEAIYPGLKKALASSADHSR